MLVKNDKHEDDNDVVTADTATDITDCHNDNNQSSWKNYQVVVVFSDIVDILCNFQEAFINIEDAKLLKIKYANITAKIFTYNKQKDLCY